MTILNGPNGITLILDPTQVCKDDPGQGTPALVTLKNETATYWCAIGEGEVDGLELSKAQIGWLERQEDAVEALFN